jgi:hypothetical protein
LQPGSRRAGDEGLYFSIRIGNGLCRPKTGAPRTTSTREIRLICAYINLSTKLRCMILSSRAWVESTHGPSRDPRKRRAHLSGHTPLTSFMHSAYHSGSSSTDRNDIAETSIVAGAQTSFTIQRSALNNYLLCYSSRICDSNCECNRLGSTTKQM